MAYHSLRRLVVAAVLGAWLIEYKKVELLDHAFMRVLRMGLIGVIATCLCQFFLLLTTNSFNIIVILIPVAFVVAEIVYEMIEGAREQAASNKWRAQQRRAERLKS